MNLALNRPAWLIETYSENGYNFSASFAVDGSTNTNAYLNGAACAATGYPVPYGWWAVDLGQPTLVTLVNLTYRGDCCRECAIIFQLLVIYIIP